ncbi:MAG: SpoIIIAH-like family protein [Clostridiales bacterium]|nr:SpoIIIAH-like family protein [Clostridiales bacterium]
MIVIAGYIEYSQRIGKENEFSDAIMDETSIFSANNEDTSNALLEDIESLEIGLEDLENLENVENVENVENIGNVENAAAPGEAVLVSGTTNVNFIFEKKIEREQIRTEKEEVLLGLINSENITDEQKQGAVDAMLEITTNMGREAAAEMMLETKGFTDVIVSITDGEVDVVVNMESLTDADRAQIEDIVKRKTEVSADKIIISPITVNN